MHGQSRAPVMIPLQHKVYNSRTHKNAELATKFQGKLGRLEGVGVEHSGDVQ